MNEFDWRQFTPVICVKVPTNRYAVIDGQHRTTAAHSIGIAEVPCYILECTKAEAAAAFAAINGNVTAVSPLDIWFAQLEAGDELTTEINNCLKAASVKFTRRKEGHAVGETRAVGVLRRAFDAYGSALFVTILQCITETGNGNPGLVVGSIVNGIGRSIRTKPDLVAQPTKLFEYFDGVSLSNVLNQARFESVRTGNPPQYIITRLLNEGMKEHGYD